MGLVIISLVVVGRTVGWVVDRSFIRCWRGRKCQRMGLGMGCRDGGMHAKTVVRVRSHVRYVASCWIGAIGEGDRRHGASKDSMKQRNGSM